MNPHPEHVTTAKALVGHLDTGVSPQHPALQGKIAQQITIGPNGLPLPEGNVEPYASHGAHTAGIICGNPAQDVSGIAPEAQLCAVAFSTHGKNLLKVLGGMDVLLGLDIRIACMAIGLRQQTPIFLPFIKAFQQKGILPILPIGNGGAGTGHAPASYPGALAVGAVHADGRVANFSGSCGMGDALKPELLAPGVHILSASSNGKTQHKSGSSMACAYVAGVAARLLQARPDASAQAIRQALIQTAVLPAEPNRCRFGIVNLEAALEAIMQIRESFPDPFATEMPAFLQNRYIDPRFLRDYSNAPEHQLLEAIVLPQLPKGENDKAPAIPEASRRLLAGVAETCGQAPACSRFFQHADAAHIQASRRFFETLLDCPGLFACQAVEVSIFDA